MTASWISSGAGPYASVRALTHVENEVGPEIFAAHALADGTFSTSDAAAHDFTKRKCAGVSDKIDGTYEAMDSDALAIVCARLRGATAASLVVKIHAACPPEDAGPFSCRDWRDELANIAPPFSIGP